MVQALYFRAEGYEIIQYANKPVHYPLHNHISVTTLGLVMDGTVTLITSGLCTDYSKGSFFIIQPLQPHELILPETYNLVTVCFQPEYVMSHLPMQIHRVLTDALKELAPVDAELLKSALNAVHDAVSSIKTSAGLPKSARALRQHPEKSIDTEKMARTEHISKYHFIRMFKRVVGLTPHRFLIQNRVRKAQKLIERGLSLADVALAAGFFDQSHFIKCFKKAVGLTPLEYKQACQNKSGLAQRGYEFCE